MKYVVNYSGVSSLSTYLISIINDTTTAWPGVLLSPAVMELTHAIS